MGTFAEIWAFRLLVEQAHLHPLETAQQLSHAAFCFSQQGDPANPQFHNQAVARHLAVMAMLRRAYKEACTANDIDLEKQLKALFICHQQALDAHRRAGGSTPPIDPDFSE